jgi:hypothetical protein
VRPREPLVLEPNTCRWRWCLGLQRMRLQTTLVDTAGFAGAGISLLQHRAFSSQNALQGTRQPLPQQLQAAPPDTCANRAQGSHALSCDIDIAVVRVRVYALNCPLIRSLHCAASAERGPHRDTIQAAAHRPSGPVITLSTLSDLSAAARHDTCTNSALLVRAQHAPD